jgi:histidinol phosphatase-like enzyme (inositol monophosphatase family)
VRPDLDTLLDFAARTAVRAGEITYELFCNSVVEYKGDGSEVTAADRAAEAYIHSAIQEAFPDDGVLGEEGADVASRSGRRWLVDPVDGTRSFAAGVPLYTVLLALEENGAPLLGCCHVPATGETLVAATGAGAWLNGSPARVSGCETLQEARVVTSGFEYWRDYGDDAMCAGWDQLVSRSRWARTWGDGFGYLLVATGRVDLLADPITGNPWDFTPFLPILQEAGARFTTFNGQPIAAWSTALAANPRLHAAAAECWAP